jgi:TRAP-type C4-dicarboxylate transport system substrate-binding protein
VRVACALVLPFVLASVGCGGGTKAGTSRSAHNALLTIANRDTGKQDLAEYVDAVNRLSDGSIKLQLETDWRAADGDAGDARTVADVRAGRVDLAKVPVRVYERLGIVDFEALRAPFLVDGFRLERAVLAGPPRDEVLRGVRSLGVEGLALLPGGLHRPFGLARPLRGPSDYRGRTIAVGPSRVAERTVSALGATPRAFRVRELTPWLVDGADLDVHTLEDESISIPGSWLTANVVLWPEAFTVIGNPAVVASLSAKQREILHEAGRAALPGAIERLEAEERRADVACGSEGLRVVSASPRELAALRRAVRPVYNSLERRAQTRTLIRRIEAMKRGLAPERRVLCSPPAGPSERAPAFRAGPETLLDGTWMMRASIGRVAEVTRATPTEAAVDAGRYRMVLRRGRLSMAFTAPQGGGWRARGSFRVRGDIVEFRTPDGVDRYRWMLYRDVLELRVAPGTSAAAPNPTFAPWHLVVR